MVAKKWSVKNKKAIACYNKCCLYADMIFYGRPYCLEELEPSKTDPNLRYKLRQPNRPLKFVEGALGLKSNLKQLNMYDIPSDVLKDVDIDKIVNQYKTWCDDIELLYPIGLREKYKYLISKNISLITVLVNSVLKNRKKREMSELEVFHMLCSTILDNRNIVQNESLVKSFVGAKASQRNILLVIHLYDTLIKNKKLLTKPEDLSYSVYESYDSMADRDEDGIKISKILSIEPEDTTLKVGSIKYDNKKETVTAIAPFSKGDVIEVAPVKVISKNEFNILNGYLKDKSIYFEIIKDKVWGLPLGYVPVYAYTKLEDISNANLRYSPSESVIRIIANKDISSGENIVVLG